MDSVNVEMNGTDSPVHRGIVILASGWYTNQLCFDVLRDDTNLLDFDFAIYELSQRGTGADHHRGRPRDAGAGWRFGVRFQQKALLGLEKTNNVRRQWVTI